MPRWSSSPTVSAAMSLTVYAGLSVASANFCVSPTSRLSWTITRKPESTSRSMKPWGQRIIWEPSPLMMTSGSPSSGPNVS